MQFFLLSPTELDPENIHEHIFSIRIPISVSFSQTLIFNYWHQKGSNGTDAKIGIWAKNHSE